MKHVLFITLGNSGQFNPLFAIATQFVRDFDDVRVTFASSNNRADVVRGAGITFQGFWETSDLPTQTLDAFINSSLRDVNVMVEYTQWIRSDGMYGAVTAPLQEWITEHKPSLIVCDILTEPAMWAALQNGVPYIINSPIPPYTCFPEYLPTIFPPVGSGTSARGRSLAQHIYDVAAVARYGIGLLARVMPIVRKQEALGFPTPAATGHSAMYVLLDTCKSLADRRVEWPTGRFQWIGTAASSHWADYDDEDKRDAAWRADKDSTSVEIFTWLSRADTQGTPVIFINFGTIYRLDKARTETIYNTLAALPVRCLWKLGKGDAAWLPEDASRNSDFLFCDWIPDIALILASPVVKLVINQGAGNGMHECLYFGKPQLCIPAWMDCFDFAMRCQDAGAGIAIMSAPVLRAGDLRDAVVRLLQGDDDNAFVSRARAISQELRALGGVEAAAQLIHSAVEDVAKGPAAISVSQ